MRLTPLILERMNQGLYIYLIIIEEPLFKLKVKSSCLSALCSETIMFKEMTPLYSIWLNNILKKQCITVLK